jgi:hypothetical protein
VPLQPFPHFRNCCRLAGNVDCLSPVALRESLSKSLLSGPVPPWQLKTLAGTGGPQAITKKLSGGVDAVICLFVCSAGLTKEEQDAALIVKAPNLLRILTDLSNALYPVAGDPVGVLRVNERDIYQLRYLLRELGEPS